MKFAKIYFFLVLSLFCGARLYALPSADMSQFSKANLAYREGKFDEAAALYKALAVRYPTNYVFQYNLGNALQRKGELGDAILAYERARLSAPRNEDVLANLNFVRNLLEYKVEDKRNEFVKVGEKILGFFTFEELAFFALLMGLLLFGTWAAALFFKSDPSWGWFRKTLVVLGLIGFGAVTLKSIQMSFFQEAIVTANEAQVYFGPSVTDQPAFRLGEGLKAFIVDSREGWDRILIPSGESGWIQEDQISEIRQ